MSPDTPLLAAIEAGGTKFVCAVAHSPEHPIAESRFPTTSPEETLARTAAFFTAAARDHGPIRAMGIGSFGPADIDPASPTYGHILKTPKQGWSGFDLLPALQSALGYPFPVTFETDVDAAAVAEAEFGAGRHLPNVCYITVGTGIGGGFLHRGSPLHGRMHPEVGHMVMPDFDTPFGTSTNVCPFHSSCLEGRASGPAIAARWGKPGADLPDGHPAWDLEAKYLAAGAVNLTAAWSPDTIILGGGVLQQPNLITRVRREFSSLAGNYWNLPPLDQYLQTPALGQQAGIAGALTLAQRLL